MPRLQGSKFLLTYPQCPLSKEEVSSFLQDHFQVKTFTVARELHQDGTPHIHAVLILERSPNTTNMRFFDIDVYHPNIKTLKTLADFDRASKYCQKDGDYVTNVEKRLSPRAQLFQRLITNPGGLTREFVKDNPEIIALNFDSLNKWMAFLNPRLQVPPVKAMPKRRHIWYYGPSNTGKSTWLTAYLELHHNALPISQRDDYNGYDITVDLLYADEFGPPFSVQSLNTLCDGRARLNTKGSHTWISYPQVVIVSNFSIEQVFSKASPTELEALHNRFQQYDSCINRPPFPTRELD